MDNRIVEVNGKEYSVQIADTDELREKGLQGVTELPENEGMVFVFDEPQTAAFWMKDTLIPLDIIYINEDWEVIATMVGDPGNEDLTEVGDVKYVLEVNSDSGIDVGDEVDLSEIEDELEVDIEDDDFKMSVLDAEGNSQMDLKGGERIFSRKNTKVLIRFAKKAWQTKADKDYKALGRKLFRFLRVQNEKDDDYVELPTE